MSNKTNPILIGVIAGLAAAVLMAAGGYVVALAIILMFLALAAIFVAGLGFGLISCLIAIVTAGVANAVLHSTPLAFALTVLPLLPAAVMSHLANMARPANELGGPDTAIAWFPLSDVLMIGAALTAVASILTTLISPHMDQVYVALSEAVQQMMGDISPDMPAMDADMKAEMVSLIRVIWPLAQAMQMMIALFAGFYFAMRFLAATGRNIRPREDMPTSLRMNRSAIAIFAGGILLMLFGGDAAFVGGSFTGAMAGGFVLAGFALIHNYMRGKSWGVPGLVLVYLLTFFFLPLIGFLLVIAGGLANPRRAIALTPNKSNPDSNPKT